MTSLWFSCKNCASSAGGHNIALGSPASLDRDLWNALIANTTHLSCGRPSSEEGAKLVLSKLQAWNDEASLSQLMTLKPWKFYGTYNLNGQPSPPALLRTINPGRAWPRPEPADGQSA